MNDNMFAMILANQQQQTLKKLIDSNQYTEKFGVKLSENEAIMLMQSRIENLKKQERVEFNEGILPKLIFIFCDSPFIYQDNYVQTIDALQEIFYLYKNESMDELSDDELLSYMKEHFDQECQGSISYLEDTCLDKFCRELRERSRGFIGSNLDEE